MASKAVAAAQGPLHAIRGTGEAEKMLKNAKTEYHNEFEEIATYTGIEALAEAVNDKETAKLARGIRREEERMAKFLEKQIPQLAKAVAKEEIPAAERRNGSRDQRRGARRRAVEQVAQLVERLQPLVERVAQLGVADQELRVAHEELRVAREELRSRTKSSASRAKSTASRTKSTLAREEHGVDARKSRGSTREDGSRASPLAARALRREPLAAPRRGPAPSST